jgi:glutaryl-CoA dehydrogenase
MPGTDVTELLAFDGLLNDEERLIQKTARSFVNDQIRPNIATWFEQGTSPKELARELGDLGLLGMHLHGYGCAGTSAVSYGLACLELEAGDSGLRSFVSVQGSLSMFSIWKYGSEEQKQQWLPDLASGAAIGCFGLTEPDFGSNPAGMRTRAARDGDDWILNGTKMWITNGSVADVATVWARTDDGIRGFLVPKGTPGFTTTDVHHKLSLRASTTSALNLDDVRLPASAMLPHARGLSGPLGCLNEARYGIVWGAMGAARDCLTATLDYATTRIQFDRPIAGFQLTQAKLADCALEYHKGLLLALHLGRLKDAGTIKPEQVSLGKLNNVRERSRSREPAALFSAAPASPWNTPRSGTPTTSSQCSPTKAPVRFTNSPSVKQSPESRHTADLNCRIGNSLPQAGADPARLFPAGGAGREFQVIRDLHAQGRRSQAPGCRFRTAQLDRRCRGRAHARRPGCHGISRSLLSTAYRYAEIADSVGRLHGWSIAPQAVAAGNCWLLSGLGHHLAGWGDRSQPRDPPGQRHDAPIVAGAAAESVR